MVANIIPNSSSDCTGTQLVFPMSQYLISTASYNPHGYFSDIALLNLIKVDVQSTTNGKENHVPDPLVPELPNTLVSILQFRLDALVGSILWKIFRRKIKFVNRAQAREHLTKLP